MPAPALPRPPVLVTRGLIKRFPGVLAVNEVDLGIRSGEIVALLGANGAGKSTLIQILAGAHPAGTYDGHVLLGGEPFRPSSVADAEAAGIVLIPQEVNVVPDLTVAQNMFLNTAPVRHGMIDWPGLYAEARAVLAEFGIHARAEQRMGSLDLASQQLVIIARALSRRSRVLILDEPTAALTEDEAARLFAHLRDLRARGVAVVFVSHRLAEVFALADRIVVMRDGRIRGDHRTAETTRESIVTEMVGSIVGAGRAAERGASPGEPALEVVDLTIHEPLDVARIRVDGISFSVRQGEIVGLFGLVGAGCGAVVKALFGAWPGKVSGRIRVNGRAARIDRPNDAVALGIGLMAQDRRETLIGDLSIADNIVLAGLERVSRAGLLDEEGKHALAGRYVVDLRIRAPSSRTRVGSLSGGNQQKVQVARWLFARSAILLLDDPTRGVDVGARADIHRLIGGLAGDGRAIVLVSSEADELLEVCDRILVLRGGRIVGELRAAESTEGQLLQEAAGA